jgi:hypothetical protein
MLFRLLMNFNLHGISKRHKLETILGQLFLHFLLEKRVLNNLLIATPGGINPINKAKEHGGRIPPPLHAPNRKQPWIIPSLNKLSINKLFNPPLRQHIPPNIKS